MSHVPRHSLYFRIFANNVDRAIPSNNAACTLFPPVNRSTALMWRVSAASSDSGVGTADPSVITNSAAGATSSGRRRTSSVTTT